MLCHEFKCIFVHIPKNAGQSIERVFLGKLGLEWSERAPLLLRPNDDPKMGPPRLAHLKARDYLSCDHVTATEFETYFKFAVVRNPWDRVLSMYRYLDTPAATFRDFVHEHLAGPLWQDKYWFVRPQIDFVADEKGKTIIDFVARFETLHQDFTQVCRRVGLGGVALPHVNRSQHGRGSKRPVSEYYDPATIERVGELYQSDIQAFNYRFEGGRGRSWLALPRHVLNRVTGGGRFGLRQ